jgi:hypothetical protein
MSFIFPAVCALSLLVFIKIPIHARYRLWCALALSSFWAVMMGLVFEHDFILAKDGVTQTGVVAERSCGEVRGFKIKYEFSVKGVTYSGISESPKDRCETYSIGQHIPITYSWHNPQVSKPRAKPSNPIYFLICFAVLVALLLNWGNYHQARPKKT